MSWVLKLLGLGLMGWGWLAGCANQPSGVPAQETWASTAQSLSAGTTRLQCDTSCLVRWNTQSRHLKALHDNRVWPDLAKQVIEINYPSDLSYYYLGRAAEGMGHTEAAATYYRLALTHLHRCEGWISDCAGFDFPRDIRSRLTTLPAVKTTGSSVATGSKQTAAPVLSPVEAPKSPAPPAVGPQKSGTGFFINAEGLMVTNWHVVEHAKDISVTAQGGLKRSAYLLGKDIGCDLAVLKTSSNASHWLPLHRSVRKVKRGSEVLTVGFPRVNLQGMEPKVTHGLISSLSGVANDPHFFQISVPIQPGNSGGPLVSRDGWVVGVVSAKLSATAAWQESSVTPENVNYAVKSNCLADLLRALPGKHRFDSPRTKSPKKNKKWKTKNQSKELSLVDLTERVEKTVGLVLVTAGD